MRIDSPTLLGKPFWMPDDESIMPYVRRFGVWEPLNTRIIASYLSAHAGATFVDVGANSGYFTVLASEVLGSRGRVMSFEPHPDLYECLQRNVADRNLQNVEAHNVAVGATSGMGYLMTHRINGGDHRLVPDPQGPTDDEWDFVDEPLPVVVVSIGKQYVRARGPLFIKVDTQGYELRVLQGMRDLVAAADENFALLCEWTPKMMVSNGDNPEDLLEWLRGHDLKLAVVDHRRGQVREFVREEFPSGPRWGDTAVDLLCTKTSTRLGFTDTHFPASENSIAQNMEIASQLEQARERCAALEREMQQRNDAASAALEEVHAQLAVARVHLNTMEQSTSWKLTAPFRRAIDKVRRFNVGQ